MVWTSLLMLGRVDCLVRIVVTVRGYHLQLLRMCPAICNKKPDYVCARTRSRGCEAVLGPVWQSELATGQLRREKLFTSVRNMSRCSVARLCMRSQSALDAFYNVVQPFATSSLSMLTPAIWCRAWAGVAKRTRGGCPRREELSTSVRNMSRCSVACLCMCCHRKRQVLLQYTPGPAPKLITSLGKSVRRR